MDKFLLTFCYMVAFIIRWAVWIPVFIVYLMIGIVTIIVSKLNKEGHLP